MFGYVKAEIPELKVREKEYYRAIYCGLCRRGSIHSIDGFRTYTCNKRKGSRGQARHSRCIHRRSFGNCRGNNSRNILRHGGCFDIQVS